jgi:L-fuculose-phosphate aldolase
MVFSVESDWRAGIVAAAKRLYQRNMLAATDGNISVRLSDQRILFTPSGLAKAFIEPDDLAVMELNGETLTGTPSAERHMHLEIYRLCPKARAIAHAHPPHAVAWSLAKPADQELPADRLSEVILGMGRIPIAPYARPGTPEMGQVLHPFLPECRTIILARHGAECWGETLDEVLNGMERIEHSAQILFLAEQLGGSTPLPESEIRALKELRTTMGDRVL